MLFRSIYAKSYNVTNGSNYTLSSVRNTNSGTVYKVGNTGITDTSPFTNALTGATNELAFLTNNSSLTLSPDSPVNGIAATLQLRNSGTVRIETGSTFNIPCNIGESVPGLSFNKTGSGKFSLSGSNSYTGATVVEQGTLALAGNGMSPVTVKSNAVLEIVLTNPGAVSATIASNALTLESGAKVRIKIGRAHV